MGSRGNSKFRVKSILRSEILDFPVPSRHGKENFHSIIVDLFSLGLVVKLSESFSRFRFFSSLPYCLSHLFPLRYGSHCLTKI